MREMKDSGLKWIGEVPEHWEVRKVKNYYHMQTGFTPDTKNERFYDDADGYDWVNISDIQDGKVITSSKKKVSQTFIDAFRPAIIPEGSLMYSFKLSVGQTAFAGKPIYSNEAIASFLPDDSVNLHYLRYSSIFIIENAQTNIYNAKILNQDLIQNAYVPFPPLIEQQKIASFLDRKCAEIDAVIEKTKATIEDYKKLKQSVITEAVTKGIRGDRPMKDSGIEWIGEIPESFTKYRIKNIGEIFGRIGFRGYTTDDLVEEGNGAITLSPSNLKDMTMNYSKLSYLSWEKYEESPEIKIYDGDILMVKTGSSYGKTALVTDLPLESTINPQLVVIKNISIDSKFLLYCFQTPYFIDQVENAVVGGTIPTMSQEKINNFFVFVPKSKEQKEIAEYLDEKCAEIDTLIAKKTALLEEMESYKKSVIYEYVTGKKEVK